MGHQFRFLKLFVIVVLASGLVRCSSEPVVQNKHAGNTPYFSKRKLASMPDPEAQLLSKLMWPIAKHKVSQEFKAEGDGRPHDGIDISAPKGTRIYAPADGTVVYAGHKFHGYGKMIIIEHNNRLATIYGHCEKLLVKAGEVVKRGNLIGLVGRTGRATAPHLHFEVRLDRVPVDPLGFLP